jgi:hypothetical protein
MARARSTAFVFLSVLLAGPACADDDASSSASNGGGPQAGGTGSGSNNAVSSSASGAGGGAPVVPGTPAVGWERAYVADSAGITCSMSLEQMQGAGAPALSFGDATLVVGFEQVSGNNQDPVVARFDSGAPTYCRYHESGGPDGRAVGLTWDGGDVAYVVYTVVGGGSGLESAAQDGWLPSYGNGGGPKVSFLGLLNAASGELDGGTFIIAKKQDGKTNTHGPAAAPTKLAAGGVEFLGESAFQPMNPDGSIMECTDYPFSTRYRFDDALTTLTCSSSTNCSGTTPCD